MKVVNQLEQLRMSVHTLRAFVLAGLVLGALAGPARAADPSPADLARAKELYENGAILYEEGSYEAAILAFEQSYALSHAPALNYNLAKCYERLGRLADARRALDLYRAVAPAEERERLERRIISLDERIAAQAAAPAPTPPLPVTPTPAPTPSVGARPNPVKWALLGGGVAVGAVGGAMIGVGYTSAIDARAANDRERYEANRTLNLAGYGVAGVGLAATVVGLVLPASAPALSIAPTGNGLSLTLATRW
jgi:tetratricopeptide (TPR) repeat protein